MSPHWVQCPYDRRIVLLSPDFSPLRLYNINTEIGILQLLQHLLFSSLVRAYQVWYKSFQFWGPQ